MNLYKRIVNGICTLLEMIAVFFLVAMIMMMVLQVIDRYIYSGIPDWSEELATLFMIVFVFIGMAVGVRDKVLISLSVIMDSSTMKKIKLPIEIIGKFLIAVFGIMMSMNTRPIFRMMEHNRLAASRIPVVWLYIFPAAVGVLIALIAVYQIYDHFKLGTDEDQTRPEDFTG